MIDREQRAIVGDLSPSTDDERRRVATLAAAAALRPELAALLSPDVVAEAGVVAA